MTHTPRITVIAAIAGNRALGKDNQLLWHLSEDLKFFKRTTQNHPIIMGRKTYDSIGRPLPNRTNIVVSKQMKNGDIAGCTIANNLSDAIKAAHQTLTIDAVRPGSSRYPTATIMDTPATTSAAPSAFRGSPSRSPSTTAPRMSVRTIRL